MNLTPEEANKLVKELKRIGFGFDVWYDISNFISYGMKCEKDLLNAKRQLNKIIEIMKAPPKYPDGDEMDNLSDCQESLEGIRKVLKLE